MSDEAAEIRYRLAAERLEALRAQWEAQGSPFTMPGNRGGTVEHVLHKLLRLQEMLVDRLAQRGVPARVGRPSVLPSTLPPPLEERRVRRVK